MLSLSEYLLFVWEPADLVMSWHAPHFLRWGEENFSKRSLVMDQKILILKRGCIMGWVNFLKGVRGIFRENRKSHICIIISNSNYASKD